MCTSLEQAYVERLQEDIIIACHRLEEIGHESLVITVSANGHLIFGSLKGKRFLVDKRLFIMDFILQCQHKETVVKVESEVVEENGITKDEDQFSKQQNKSLSSDKKDITSEESGKDQKESIDRYKSDANYSHILVESEATNTLADDTDDVNETENIASLMSAQETEIDNISVDQKARGDNMNTDYDMGSVVIKEETFEFDTSENPQYNLKQVCDDDENVLNKIKEIINSNHATGLGRTSGLKAYETEKDTPACDICDKELSTWAGVKRRKICYHTEEKYHESEKSEKDVEFKEGPPKHKLEHSNNEEQTYEMDKPELRRYVCDTCGSVYQSSSNLRRHMEKHTDKKAYCHCGASFTYKESLQRHMKAVHLGGYKCKHCHEIFTSQTTLSVHSRKVHTKNPLQCQMCGKIFGHASHLKDHSIVHLDVKQFYCETCGKRFKHKRACKLHMKHFCKGPKVKTNSVQPAVHTCSECNKTFRTLVYLKQHKQKHENQKRPCPKCGRVFIHNSSLSRHIVTCN